MPWNPHDQEDASQEVHIKLLQRHRSKIDDPDRYRKRVLRNALCDSSRRKTRGRQTEELYIERRTKLLDGQSDNPAMLCERQETVEIVRHCVNQLPSRQRDVIDAVCLQELSVREASTRLGISETGINSALYHGRANLRRALIKECADGQNG